MLLLCLHICVCFPGATAFSACFCWLHRSALLAARSHSGPHTNSRKQLCAAAIHVDSPATPCRHRHTRQRMQPPSPCTGIAPATHVGKPHSSSLHPSTPAQELTTNQPESKPEVKMIQPFADI